MGVVIEGATVVSATDKVGIPPRGSEVAGCVGAEELGAADMFACTTRPSKSMNWSMERSPTLETAGKSDVVIGGRLGLVEEEGRPGPRVE